MWAAVRLVLVSLGALSAAFGVVGADGGGSAEPQPLSVESAAAAAAATAAAAASHLEQAFDPLNSPDAPPLAACPINKWQLSCRDLESSLEVKAQRVSATYAGEVAEELRRIGEEYRAQCLAPCAALHASTRTLVGRAAMHESVVARTQGLVDRYVEDVRAMTVAAVASAKARYRDDDFAPPTPLPTAAPNPHASMLAHATHELDRVAALIARDRAVVKRCRCPAAAATLRALEEVDCVAQLGVGGGPDCVRCLRESGGSTKLVPWLCSVRSDATLRVAAVATMVRRPAVEQSRDVVERRRERLRSSLAARQQALEAVDVTPSTLRESTDQL